MGISDEPAPGDVPFIFSINVGGVGVVRWGHELSAYISRFDDILKHWQKYPWDLPRPVPEPLNAPWGIF